MVAFAPLEAVTAWPLPRQSLFVPVQCDGASQARHLPNTSEGCKTALEELELNLQAAWLGKGQDQKSHRLPLALLEEMALWSLGTCQPKPPPA